MTAAVKVYNGISIYPSKTCPLNNISTYEMYSLIMCLEKALRINPSVAWSTNS